MKRVEGQLRAAWSSIDRMMWIVVAEDLKEYLLNVDFDDPTQSEKIDQAVRLIVNKQIFYMVN